jgi:hypothetical protein
VSRDGPTGKRLLSKPAQRKAGAACPPDKIRNPDSGRCVSRDGPTGKRLLSQKQKSKKNLGEIRRHKENSLFYIWEYNPDTDRPAWLRFDTWRHGKWRKFGHRIASTRDLDKLRPSEQKAAMKGVAEIWYKKSNSKSQSPKPPKGTTPNSPDALLVAAERVLKRLAKKRTAETPDLKPPKSMLLTMAQVKRIRNNQLVLPVVPPQDYDKTHMLTAHDEHIAKNSFWDDGRLAVTGGSSDVWWVITPQLVAWLESKL